MHADDTSDTPQLLKKSEISIDIYEVQRRPMVKQFTETVH